MAGAEDMENSTKTDSLVNPICSDGQETQPFQGLLEDEGHVYSNWGLSRSTQPAVYVEPINYLMCRQWYVIRSIFQLPYTRLVPCSR
jgi:hypothetical protein